MYDTVNQLLSSTNPNLGFTYDAAGNMTKGYTPQGYEFTAAYNAENRLKSIQYTDGGTSVVHRIEYVYGGSGFVGIIKKYENNILVNETRMVRDGYLELQERDQNNAIIREYVWGLNLGGGIGGLLSMRQQGQNFHYLYDGKGNVSAVLDAAQQIVASYRYDTFGRLIAKSGTLDQPFQFSTKRYDPNTGLNYYGYRFYSPVLGRWINRDPLGEEGGINLYGFVENNPVNYADPNGQNAIAIGLGGAGTLGAFGTAGVWTGGAALAGAAGYGITAWAIHDTWLGRGGIGDAVYDLLHPRGKVIPFPGARAKPKRWEPIPDAATDKHEHCLRLYLLCGTTTPKAPCGQCMLFCETQGYWDYLNCPICK